MSVVSTVPIKPDATVLNAAKKTLDPRTVMEVVVNETPQLRSALKAANLKDDRGEPLIRFFDDNGQEE